MRRCSIVWLITFGMLLASCGRPNTLSVGTAQSPSGNLQPSATARSAPTLTPSIGSQATPLPIASAAPAPATLNTPFQLKVGEKVTIDSLTIAFDAVSDDSRCPKGVQCFWSGAVTVDLTLTRGDGSAQQPRLTLPALPDSADRIDYTNLTIQLVDVAPYPESKGPQIRQQDYVATLLVAPVGAPAPTSAPASRPTAPIRR